MVFCGRQRVRRNLMVLGLAMLAGCGVETATTAATGAAIKKQELDARKKTMDAVQKKIEESMQQSQKRADD